MFRLTFRLLVVLCLVQYAQAQLPVEWIRTYDDGRMEMFLDLYRVADEGYIACGKASNEGIYPDGTDDIWIVRINNSGEVIWSETFGRDGAIDVAYSIIEADNGDFLAVGTSSGNITAIRINSDGEQIWWENYGGGNAYAVIELQSGEFLIAGHNGANEGYLIYIDGEGEPIWTENYVLADWHRFWAMRETDGGVVVAGYYINDQTRAYEIWAIKIDPDREGATIWSNTYLIAERRNECFSIVSAGDGGFLLTGTMRDREANEYNDAFVLKIDDEGNREWARRYAYGNHESAKCIERLPNGNFVVVGLQQGGYNQFTTQISPNGEELWHRIYNLCIRNNRYEQSGYFFSVIIGHDESILAAGHTRMTDELGAWNGLIIKLEPEILEPIIMYWSPEDTMLTVLQRDTVQFIVRARDQRGQELSYLWIMEGDTLSTDTTTTVIFNDLGMYDAQCQVSNEEFTSAITWHVEVSRLYIDSYTPDSLNIAIRRNATVDFRVHSRFFGGGFVNYGWKLNDEVIEDAFRDNISILFEFERYHEVEAVVSFDELSDNVVWQVTMLDLIVDYWPRQFDLEVTADTLLEFMIEPFNPQDDLLNIRWTLDGDSIDHRSWTYIDFDSVGQYQVAVYVSDSTEVDSVIWNIDVNPNEIVNHDLNLLPDVPTLYSPSPNPFNAQTTVRYALPTSEYVTLELFDISGRLVTTLVDQHETAGMHSVAINGNNMVSGVYFIRMTVGSEINSCKALLLK